MTSLPESVPGELSGAESTPIEQLGDELAVTLRWSMAGGASVDALFHLFDAFIRERIPLVFPAGDFDARAFCALGHLYERSRPALDIAPHRDVTPQMIRAAVRRRQDDGDLSPLDDLAADMRRPLTSYLAMRFDRARRCYYCGEKRLHVRIQPRRIVIAGISDPIRDANYEPPDWLMGRGQKS